MKNKERLQRIYPWVIVAAGFLMVMVGLGFGSYSRSTYMKVVTEQLGMDRGAFSLSDTFRNLVTAFLSVYFGRLLLRYNVRKMIAAGFLALIGSFVFNAIATSYIHFYIAGILLGVGLAWTTTTMVGVLVERWFRGNTGTIMGVILAANGIGGFLSENVTNRIIYGFDLSISVMDGRWRAAYWFTAILFLIAGIVIVLLIRNSPEDMGLSPIVLRDKKEKAKRRMDWDGFSLKELIKKPYFYMILLSVTVCGFMLQAMITLAKPHMQDVGISINVINTAYSIYAFVLLFAKITSGIIFDRFGLKCIYSICCISALLAMILLVFQGPDHSIFTYLYIILAPIALPLETVLIPLLVKEVFGMKNFTKIMGYFVAANTLGMAIGTSASNIVFDIFGSYLPCLKVLIVCFAATTVNAFCAFILADRDRKRYLKNQTEA